MAQHFPLSAQARTLSLKHIYKAGEEAAYNTFRATRWSETGGEAVCPRCGCVETYDISTRRKFKCAACGHQFSVTSGTIFASRKMDFIDLLAAICLFVNGVKGMSALQMSRDLDVQYKTAFVMMHKLREVLAAEMRGLELAGEIEIDGCYIGGHIRPSNLKEDRVDRRKAEHQTGTRRVVVALRQRGGRTLPFIAKREGEGVEIASRIVAEGSTIFADEAAPVILRPVPWYNSPPLFLGRLVISGPVRCGQGSRGKGTRWDPSIKTGLLCEIGTNFKRTSPNRPNRAGLEGQTRPIRPSVINRVCEAHRRLFDYTPNVTIITHFSLTARYYIP